MCHRLAICLVALLILSSAAHCSDWMTRPGTIQHAMMLPDGSHVCLDAVVVQKINASASPANFVIHEWFDSASTLVVLTQPSPDLRLRQSVDVEGVISTLPDGRRVITDATVLGYTDRDGNLLRSRMKGLLEPYPWQWKVDLTVSGESPMMRSESFPSAPLLDSPTGLELCQTIADAKAVSDGTAVELRCKPIASIGSGFFVMGEDGSQDTLKVYYTGTVSTPDRVRSVLGTVQTEGSDRVLNVDSGPGYDPQVFEGSLRTAATGSMAWVKTWADGHTFASGDITGKIVTRAWADYLYIEENDRSCGIRVEKTNHGRHRNERIDVVGALSTNADQERYIAATTVTLNGSGTLKPIGIGNKSLGGEGYAYLPGPPASGQRGITDAYGVNNIGLLVTIWGKVTALDATSPPQWFRVDDGSMIEPKIAYPPYGISLDDYVLVSGISSCEYDAQNDLLFPVLRPQPVTAAINQASGQSDPTNTSPVNFTVTFSESVSGFTADDVAVSGTSGGTKTITITPTDTAGQVYNVAVSGMTAGTVIASIPFGRARNQSGVWNYSSTSTDNTVTYDDAAPTVPSGVAVDHIIPTSRKVRGHWNASTDTGSGLKDYLYQFYYVASGNEYTVTSWMATTSTSAVCTLSFDPSTSDGKAYYIRVKSRDNALNVSSVSASAGVACQKSQVAYMYRFADVVFETYPPTDGLRRYVDSRLANTASANSSIMQYTKLGSFPGNLDTYDVLVISCPDRNLTLSTDQVNQIAAWANKWHHRLVLVGDSSFYRPDSGSPYGYFNNRLNAIATVVNSNIPAFKTAYGDIPSPYNIGTCTRFQYTRSWLLTGVTELKFASPGWFNFSGAQQTSDWVAEIDYAYRWIIERDLSNGGMCLAIHDMNVFDTANTSSSHANFVRNFCTKFE